MANATSTQLQELYVAYFGRAADPTGLDYWTEKGISTAKFAADMYAQAEFKDAYGSLSTEAQVNQIYKNLFDREADVTGLTYWTQQVNLGELKLAEIATHLIWAAQNNTGSSDDKTALTNRTNAAVAYTAKVKETTAGVLAYQAQSTSPWVSGDNIAEAISYLSGIDKDTAHTAAGVAASVTKITTTGVPAASSVFKLTTGIDNFTGGAGNDSFTSTNSTLQANDNIVGGAGTDSLDYVDSSTSGTAMPAVALTDIENITVRNLSGNAASAGSAEVQTVTTGALKDGQYITVAGQTLSATADVTAANVATVLAGGSVSGLSLTGTLTTGYTKAAGTNTDEVTYTFGSVGDQADLAIGGNSGTATSSVRQLTIGGTLAATNVATYTYNGATITTPAFNGTNVSNAVTQFVTSLNSTAGKTIAYAHGGAQPGLLTIKDDGGVALGGFATTSNTNTTYALKNGAGTQTLAVSGISANQTFTFLINGESVTTGVAGTTTTTSAAAIVSAINTWAGRTIASNSTNTVTVDSGNYPLVISEPVESGTISTTFIMIDTASAGNILSPDATVISTVDGVAATSASSNAQSVDTSQWTGVNQYKNFASTNALTFASVAENDKLVVSAVTAGSAATTAIQYAAAVVKGDSTVGTLELESNTSAGAITIGDSSGNGIETLNITATGKNTVSSITSNSATAVTLSATGATDVTISSGVSSKGTLTVTGAGKVTLNTLDTAFDTVDASGNSGGIVVTDVGDKATVYTLSSGDDKFTTSADGFASTDKFAVDAGDGTDTLVIAAAADMNTATEANRYTNFETLSLVAGQDVSLVSGITAITAAAMSTQTISGINSTAADAITFTGTGSTTTLTLTNATGSSDSVTIDLKSGTSTTNVSATGLVISGVETLSVSGSTGTAGTDSAITFGTANVLKAVNLSGTADMSITASNITKAVTLDSTSTGAITITGDFVKGGSFTTGSGKDEVTLSTNLGSTYNTGAGNDTITTAFASLVATGSDDHVVNAGAGTDTITFSNGSAPVIVDNHFTNVTGLEKLTMASTGDASITTGAAFKTAFADSLTITSGAMGEAASFVYSGGLYDKDTTITISGSDLEMNAVGENYTITTGAGNDTVKTGTGTTLVGPGSANGSAMTISTGAGNDTIEFGYGTLTAQTTTDIITITGGKGVDTITKNGTPVNSTTIQAVTEFVFADGDSTVDGYDTITGFSTATATGSLLSDMLNIGTGASVGTSIGSTDFGTLKSHSLSGAGEVSFDDAATYSAAVVINSSNLSDVTGYLNANLGENTTVSFEYDNSGNGTADSTFVFTNLASSNSSADTLILLKDTIGAGLTTTATLTTNTIIAIG